MEQQKIFRQIYIDSLNQKVKNGEGIEFFKNKEFQVDGKNLLIMPHLEKPLGLLAKMNPDSDFESAIAIYEAYINLTPLEAAEPKFWNYLSTVDLYKYLTERWPNLYSRKENTNEIEYIFSHFLMQNNSSDIMRVHLSGLWWSVYLTIDESNEDKYHLTKILFWNQTLRTRTMGTYLFARKKEIALGFLDYCEQRGKENFGNFETEHQELTEYLNKIGGAKPIALFSREEIKQILIEKFPIPGKNTK